LPRGTIAVAGERHEVHADTMGGRAQATSDVASARIRKADIDEHDVRPSFFRESERIARIRRAESSMSEEPEKLDEELARVVVVFHHEHIAYGGARLSVRLV